MFKWVTGNTYSSVVTFNSNNFTLNSVASQYFNDVRWCVIGIDEKGKKVAIRPITAREKDLNVIPLENLNKVSVGNGYTRISNKSVLDKLAELVNHEWSGQKFLATYDEKEKMLIIDLTQGL